MFRATGATARRVVLSVALLIPAAAVSLGWFTHSGRGRLMIWVETGLIWLQHVGFGVGLGQYNLHQLEAQHRFFGLGDWTARFQQTRRSSSMPTISTCRSWQSRASSGCCCSWPWCS